MSDEYWLISAPGKPTPRQTYDQVCTATGKDQLSTNFIFNIPDLKVGTLDSLVSLSDDLGRLDTYIEGVTRKLAQYFGEVLEGEKNKLAENLVVGPNNVDPVTYVTDFQWDHAKYPTKQSLKTLSEVISKAVTHVENELKLRSHTYNNVKQSLQALEKKQAGSLLTRNLNDVVKRENFLLGSEYLKTLLVCVPKALVKDWNEKYETLCAMIVPRTAELIAEDQDFCLFTVTLFQKTEDTFKHKCRENKFTVREFTFDEQALSSDKQQLSKLETDRQQLYGSLVRWLKINFGEVFSASIHIKALRIFVESVLRYGLPVNFAAIVIHPWRRAAKKLRDVLNQLFGYLDQSSTGRHDDNFDIPGVFSSQQEYYPYVYLKNTQSCNRRCKINDCLILQLVSNRFYSYMQNLAPFIVYQYLLMSTNVSSHSNDTISLPVEINQSYKVRLFLFRHAESQSNIKRDIIAGQANEVDLTDLGCKQAQLLGKRLKIEKLIFDQAYTSTAVRTKRTAEIALTEAQLSLPDNAVEDLCEQSQGDWEGIHRHEIYTPQTIQKMEVLNFDHSAPNGESLRQVQRRALKFLNPLIDRAKKESIKQNRSITIGIFSHGGTIRSLIQHFIQSNPKTAWLISNENTAINEFVIDPRGTMCVRVNDVGHLLLLA
ncbi:unnamed protein product [Didymodactylos carnosus]|uniref:V-type proton ATPase subunit C n=1 Tax=Didymodactylos carnosus TaxID=1234261 RepID=A0A813Z9I3_9BILA|nr:unnamed protein product [Didymodactylos carnosus]CAF0895122.1 unnamed protein product [Didymodactylos carnosus]CAF3514680.1 unnamed protein product [Didymodactylos carnosus]CAF3678676.1 unnamed protein product [Didymodactylos carnosus]